jgi:hypothetical protein
MEPPGFIVACDTVSPSDSTGVFGVPDPGGGVVGSVGVDVGGGVVGSVGGSVGGSDVGGSVGGSDVGGSVGGSDVGGSVGGSEVGGSVGGSDVGGSDGVSVPGGSDGVSLIVVSGDGLSSAYTGWTPTVPMSVTAPSPARTEAADRERTPNAPPPRRDHPAEMALKLDGSMC